MLTYVLFGKGSINPSCIAGLSLSRAYTCDWVTANTTSKVQGDEIRANSLTQLFKVSVRLLIVAS